MHHQAPRGGGTADDLHVVGHRAERIAHAKLGDNPCGQLRYAAQIILPARRMREGASPSATVAGSSACQHTRLPMSVPSARRDPGAPIVPLTHAHLGARCDTAKEDVLSDTAAKEHDHPRKELLAREEMQVAWDELRIAQRSAASRDDGHLGTQSACVRARACVCVCVCGE